jgi:HAMP domain-containing protein
LAVIGEPTWASRISRRQRRLRPLTHKVDAPQYTRDFRERRLEEIRGGVDRRIADRLDKEINILGAEALKAVNANPCL